MNEIIYLRKKDDDYVYIANSSLLENPDLLRCDKEGNFLTSGTKSMERLDSEFAKEKEDLYKMASDLNIKVTKNMKLSTVIKKIITAERIRVRELEE